MIAFFRQSDERIRAYLDARSDAPFSYAEVGCTRHELVAMAGWNIDRIRVPLGHGANIFQRAREAIASWRMFPEQVATLCWPDLAPREGAVVGVLYWAGPLRLWMLMPTRVVYCVSAVVEQEGRAIERFGFAYGTLDGHVEQGEERFLVEWDRSNDCVSYDLLAVSRPAHWLARVGYPYTRWEQARFRRLSGQAMQKATLIPIS